MPKYVAASTTAINICRSLNSSNSYLIQKLRQSIFTSSRGWNLSANFWERSIIWFTRTRKKRRSPYRTPMLMNV